MHNVQSLHRFNRRAVDPSLDPKRFDLLTGVATRRFFRERLQTQWQENQQDQVSTAIMLVDLDGFRDYRAKAGKAVVYDTLRRVGLIISDGCRRRGDFAGRLRAAEFAMMLSQVDLEGARFVAERVRDAIHESASPEPGTMPLTASVGGCCIVPPTNRFHNSAIIAADQAIKRAKTNGRNWVEITDEI